MYILIRENYQTVYTNVCYNTQRIVLQINEAISYVAYIGGH